MIISELFEAPQRCPECGGISFSNLILAEKKDACYHKVKASAKVWPSAYASGRLVQCRKKGAANYGNKNESMAEQSTAQDTVGGINTSGAKSLTKKVLGRVGRAVMPTLGFTDAAERLSNKDYTGAGISAAAGGIGLIPAWPAQLASGGLELVNMTRDEANALGGYDKLAKEISKNFTIPEYDPSYLPENPAQSEGVVGTGVGLAKAAYNRGKDFVRYLRRDAPEPPRVIGGTLDQGPTTMGGVKRPAGTVSYSNQPGTARTVQQQDLLPGETLDQAMRRIANQSGSKDSDKLGGKNVKTTPGSTLKPGSTNVQLDPVVDVPTYIRQGKPDPVTIPKPGTKPKIIMRPGETMDQAIERTRDAHEFSKFLKGQGEQTFVPPGAVNPDLGNVRPGLDEESRKKRKEPEAKYDDEYDAMVARVKKLAGLGPMKTVYDPAKRVYKNVPTAQQPKVQPKK